MFGYLLPFLENVQKEDGNVYLFRDCGPVMNEIIAGIPGYQLGIFDGESIRDTIGFRGYDSPDFPGMDMERSKERIFDIFGTSRIEEDLRVLVVERVEPHPFYAGSKSEVPGSGSSRRSVPNMHDVFESISRVAPAHFVHLEGMSLKDQIGLFCRHSRFVLQHGAAMANLLFARRGSVLLEIRDDATEDYFSKMKSSLKLRHGRFRQAGCHSKVYPEKVVAQLAGLMRPPISLL